MASASTTVNVTCPHCDKTLRLSKRPAAGKKIKCPACSDVFTPELENDDEGTAIQERPNIKANAKSSSRNRAEDDEDDAPRKRRRDEDDEDDDDDRPAKKKKGKQKAGSNMLLFGLIGAGAVCLLLACGGVGLTAFVWPGFMLSKNDTKVAAVKAAEPVPDQPKVPVGGQPVQQPPPQAPQARGNLAAFVMPNADLVLGLNVQGLRDAGQMDQFMAGFQAGFQAAQPGGGVPPEFNDVIRNCDKVLMSAKADTLAGPAMGGVGAFGPGIGPMGPPRPNGPKGFPKGAGGPKFGPNGPPIGGPPGMAAAPPKVAIAIQMANAAAAGRLKDIIKTIPGAGAEEQLAGRYAAIRQRAPGTGETTFFVFPADRIVVIAPLSDQEITNLLDRATRNEAASPQLAKMTALVEQSQFWASYTTDAQVRGALGALPLLMGGQPGGLPPAAQDGLNALGRVKGGSVAFDTLPGGSIKIQLHVDCDDAAAAKALKDGGDFAKTATLADLQRKANDPTMPRTLMQDLNTLNFATQGTLTSASVSISAQTINDVKNILPGIAGVGGPPQPPKGFPPPPIDPKFGPGPGPMPGPGGQTKNYAIVNLGEQKFHEQAFQFQNGKKVNVKVVYASLTKNNNVDLYVFQGAVQQNKIAAFDEKNLNPNRRGRVCEANFTAQGTDSYTIRVLNRGPGVTGSCTVIITEK